MKAFWFLLYVIFAYATYFNSQRYKANAYLWTILGFGVPYAGFIISLLYFRKKVITVSKPSAAPLGFRSKAKWKMAVATITYFMFFLVIGIGVFGSTAGITPQSTLATATGDNVSSQSKVQGNTSNTATKSNQDQPSSTQNNTANNPANNPVNAASNNQDGKASVTTAVNGELKVHYIDVGQADSILVQQAGKNMLIDAGNNPDADTVINYLKNNGVDRLDVIVATHPHEDHIGAMDEVINNFDVGTVYASNATATTQTYKNFINSVKSKGLKLTRATPGTEFDLGDAKSLIVAPNSDNYDDLNNYSVVIKLIYGTSKFIFQGDAEDISENEILNSGYDISADVIKIGHHGSESSSTQAYLNKVNPKYAIISVGKGNTYGHPASATISRLNSMGVNIYRTDENSTVVAVSDGNNIIFNSIPSGVNSDQGYTNNDISNGSDAEVPIAFPEPMPADTPASGQTDVSVSVSVDDPNPAQNTTINLIVTGPAGGEVNAVCHYKSTNTPYGGIIGSDGKVAIPLKIGRAAKGFTVDIDVTVNYAGNTYSAATSFTPQ